MACMSRANLYRGWRWILLKATHAAHVVARAAILGRPNSTAPTTCYLTHLHAICAKKNLHAILHISQEKRRKNLYSTSPFKRAMKDTVNKEKCYTFLVVTKKHVRDRVSVVIMVCMEGQTMAYGGGRVQAPCWSHPSSFSVVFALYESSADFRHTSGLVLGKILASPLGLVMSVSFFF